MKELTKTIGILYVLIITTCPLHSQAAYIKEQLTLTNMLSGKDSMNLQKAVYAVENAYYEDNLNEDAFNQQIEWYTAFCRGDYAIRRYPVRRTGRRTSCQGTMCRIRIHDGFYSYANRRYGGGTSAFRIQLR